MKQVARYRDKAKIDAAVTIARRLEEIAANAADFDRHPHLLNVGNGVVDLRTGELVPHDPTLRLTRLAGADYLPGAVHADVMLVLEALDSDVADLKNVGGKWGGAVTAAKFLEEFSSSIPWAHLDIAGPSWNDGDSSTRDAGGTGCFVRTLTTYLESKATSPGA